MTSWSYRIDRKWELEDHKERGEKKSFCLVVICVCLVVLDKYTISSLLA
jgi:hypothetical protein